MNDEPLIRLCQGYDATGCADEADNADFARSDLDQPLVEITDEN
jgi:hypothetical protein